MEENKKKYKQHSSDIDFTVDDLDYKNICKNTYNQVIEKFKYMVMLDVEHNIWDRPHDCDTIINEITHWIQDHKKIN